MVTLSHLSVEAIYQYLDPNFRIHLSQHIPALRQIDYVVPLKIKNLEIHNFSIKINEVEYKLGIVRHYKGAEPPKLIREENERGGVQFDVGKFKKKDSYISHKRNAIDRKPSKKEYLINFENEKNLKKILNSMKLNGPYTNAYNMRIQKQMNSEVKCLRSSIRTFNEQLAHSKLKFAEFIQLTRTKDGQKTVELVCYSSEIQKAWDYIMNQIFGQRRRPTEVQKLSKKIESSLRFDVEVRHLEPIKMEMEGVMVALDGIRMPVLFLE